MEADQFVNVVVDSKWPMDGRTCEKGQNDGDDNESDSETDGRVGDEYSSRIEKEVVGLSLQDDNISHSSSAFVLQAYPCPHFNYTNQGSANLAPTKKWKKLVVVNKSAKKSERPGFMDRRPDLELSEVAVNKR